MKPMKGYPEVVHAIKTPYGVSVVDPNNGRIYSDPDFKVGDKVKISKDPNNGYIILKVIK